MKMKKTLIGLTILLSISLLLFADEGMWLLNQLKNLDLEKKGITTDVSEIYSPGKPCIANAVVHLGGGTAELVSPHGLILTNHHVAFRAVQRASTGGTDFITQGFLAKTHEEEIEGPGYTARILQSIEDVTQKFARFNKIKDPVKREKAIEAAIKKMTEKIEKSKIDIDAEIARMYEGKQYILFVYKRFDDVRVVYVPPLSIGNYGGEIDNWMWPRHTGDFSFMRIYTAPDGTGRKYHKDNVPYKPEYWLKLASTDLKQDDQTFILGYPGGTQRYRTSYSVRYYLEYYYSRRIKIYNDYIKLLETYGQDSQVAKAKVMGLIKGLNNGMKFYQGNLDVMKRTDFLQKKIQFENELMTFLKKDEKLYNQYGNILERIKGQYTFIDKYKEQDEAFTLWHRLSGTITTTAQRIYNMVKERAKPKKMRDPEFSEKDNKRAISRLHFIYMSFYEPADKGMLVYTLKMAAQLPENQRITGLDYILNDKTKTIEQWVNEAYKNTKLKDVEYAKTLFYKPVKELDALDDPLIQLAKNIYAEGEALKKKNETFDANINELRKEYINALYTWKGTGLYPDANSTIRFSYGRIKGYSPRDAVVYKPFTTIKGMLEKDTGQEPFDMLEDLKKLYKNRDLGRWTHPQLKVVPIAFTHTVDSTGGNSGSPVLNAKGELVGILFDGNYEAMACDWQYDPEIQRSISVDIRFVMFVTEKLAGAHHILREMGVK
jgi:hypothetical protein